MFLTWVILVAAVGSGQGVLLSLSHEKNVKTRLFRTWQHVETISAGKRTVIKREDRMVYEYGPNGVNQWLLVGELSPFQIADEVNIDNNAIPMRLTLCKTSKDGVRRCKRSIFKFEGMRLIIVTSGVEGKDFPSTFISTEENGYSVSIYESD
jgi:hypothetical protein